MSLKDAATAAATSAAQAHTAARDAENDRDGAKIAELLADLLDQPVRYIDTWEGSHPVKRGSGYASYIGTDRHQVHRLLVDDVLMWWLRKYEGGEPLAGTLAVERACRSCGQAAFLTMTGIGHLTGYEIFYGTERRRDRDDEAEWHERARTPKARAGYTHGIGVALQAEAPFCWECAVGVPSMCPTCGHQNGQRLPGLD